MKKNKHTWVSDLPNNEEIKKSGISTEIYKKKLNNNTANKKGI